MKKIGVIVGLMLIPIIVLGVGSTKRIIELPGFNANRALIVNGSNEIDESTVTSTELGYLSGATANVLTEASTIPLIQLEALTSNNIVITDNSGFLADSFVDSAQVQYLSPVNSDLCGIDDACTFTQKTLIQPIIDIIALEGQTATPLSPSAGDLKFYAKSDEKLYFLNSSGIEQEVGAGSSGNNYFPDYNADQTSNLTQFDDVSSAVDLEGGTATNLTVTSNTSTPIYKLRSYRISKGAANASWEGQRLTFSGTQIDELAKSGKPFVFSFFYETSANYNAGTEAVSIYYYRVGVDSTAQVCNGRTLGSSVSNTLGVATTAQQFACSFTLTSATTAVRIAWVVTGTGTSTWDLDIDNVYFGPDVTVPGVIVTDWETCTVTGSWIANTTYTARCKRQGDNLLVRGTLTISGGAPTSANLSINLPSGYSIQTSKLPSTNNTYTFLGNAKIREDGVGTADGFAVYNDSTSVNILYLKLTSTDDSDGYGAVTATVPGSFNTGDAVYFDFTVPVTQFANQSAVLSTTQVDLSTLYVRGSGNGGTVLTADTTNIDFTEVTDPNGVWSGTVLTVPATGDYLFVGTVVFNAGFSGNVNAYVNGTFRDNAGYGSGDTRVKLNAVIRANTGDTISFRADSNSTLTNSSVHNLTVKAQPNFSTFGVYGIYEYTEAECSASVTATTGGTFYDLTGASVVLTPGTWQICHMQNVYHDWVLGSAVGQACIGTIRDSANNRVNGSTNLFYMVASSDVDSIVQNSTMCAEVTISTTTTYKSSLQCSSNATAISTQAFCGNGFSGTLTDPDSESKIWARRMK
jgi:hypothetical protein